MVKSGKNVFGMFLEVAWSSGSLGKNSKDTAAGELTPDSGPDFISATC